MVRRVIRFVPLLLVFSLCSCEWWKQNAAYWNSPQGQAQTMMMMQSYQQGMQIGSNAHNQRMMMLQEQARWHHEQALRMTPIRVKHSGRIDLTHSGSIRVRR